MEFDIEEQNEEKKLNYKRLILVIAIVVAIIACIYIGIILPQLVKNKEKNNENINTTETNTERNEIDMETIVVPIDPVKTREEEKPYPIITSDGIDKIKGIYKSDYKRVFLTFDDGPSKTVTPQILTILDNYNVKATFFVLGSRVEIYPEIVKEEFDKGHYIGNHGYSHKYSYIYESVDNIINEYNGTENIIRNAIGKEDYYSNVFRFPGGSPGGKYAKIKSSAIPVLEQNNIAYLDWNCLTRDSEGSFTKEELIQNLISTAQNKESVVVLMHDAGNKQTTYEALPQVIEYFQNNGYVFENLYNILDGQ